MNIFQMLGLVMILSFIGLLGCAVRDITKGEKKRNRQVAWSDIYIKLSREDFESLGVSETMLYRLVGGPHYARLMKHWYGPRADGYATPPTES
jgi:hypothetical protein